MVYDNNFIMNEVIVLEIIKGKTMKDLNMIPITSFLPKTDLKPGEFDINKEKYVRDKLKEDPDFECWDFLKYASYKQGFCIYSNHVLVSNTGKIAYELTDGTHINSGIKSANYIMAHIDPTLTNTYINIYLHRAVACTYLAIPEKYKELGEGKLEVNHLDGVKTNPHFLNLEWGTKSDNLKHAVANGLIKSGIDDPNAKPLLGVVINGPNKGHRFVICGRSTIKSLGFNVDTLYQCARGETKTGHGCIWTFISKDTYGNYPEITKELAFELTSDPSKNNANTRPLIAEVVKDCEIKGLKFAVYGGKEASSFGFSQPHISKVCSGKLKSHGGCKWAYGTHEEAETLQRGLTKEQKDLLK